MRLVVALSMCGLTLFTSGCGPAQWLIRDQTSRDPVPAEYLVPRTLPAPPKQIDQCPIWSEQIKTEFQACEGDKVDIKAWSDRQTTEASK